MVQRASSRPRLANEDTELHQVFAGFGLPSADAQAACPVQGRANGSAPSPRAALPRRLRAFPSGVLGRQVAHLLQVLLEDGQLLRGKRL
jgi:hypothetical protein